MMAGTLHDEIIGLRAENERLKEENLAFREMFRAPNELFAVARSLGLLPSLGVALKLFSEREQVSHRALCALSANPAVSEHYSQAMVCRLRHVVRPHGIEINAVFGWGYSISPEHQVRLRALIESVRERLTAEGTA